MQKLDSLDYISVADNLHLASLKLTQFAPKEAAVCVQQCIMTATGPFKITDFGTDQKPVWDLRLVNITNL